MRKLHCPATLVSLTQIAAAPVCRAGEHRASAEISVLDDKQCAKIDMQELKLASCMVGC